MKSTIVIFLIFHEHEIQEITKWYRQLGALAHHSLLW